MRSACFLPLQHKISFALLLEDGWKGRKGKRKGKRKGTGTEREGKERTGQDRIGQYMKGNESKAKERMGSKGKEGKIH